MRWVLEGSVQPSQGNQVRVNAQLIDADSGVHMWAEQFDAATVLICCRCRTRLSPIWRTLCEFNSLSSRPPV